MYIDSFSGYKTSMNAVGELKPSADGCVASNQSDVGVAQPETPNQKDALAWGLVKSFSLPGLN